MAAGLLQRSTYLNVHELRSFNHPRLVAAWRRRLPLRSEEGSFATAWLYVSLQALGLGGRIPTT